MTVTLTINVDSDTRLTREQLFDLDGKLNEACSSIEKLRIGFITAEFAVDGETFSYDEIQDYEGLSEDSDTTAQK